MKVSIFNAALFCSWLGITSPSFAQTNLPSTEQFMNALGACAASMNLKLSADLLGSVKSIYEGAKIQGTAVLQNSPEFLKLFPEADRTTAYKLYLECITQILKTTFGGAAPPKKEACVANYTECAEGFKTSIEAAIQACERYVGCDPNNPNARSMLGQALTDAGRLPQAADQFQDELAYAKKTKDKTLLSKAYYDLSRLSFKQGALDQAEQYAQMSINEAQTGGNQLRLALAQRSSGDIYRAKGNLAMAEDSYKKAVAVQERIGDKIGLGQTYVSLGNTVFNKGDRPTGCSYLRRARELYVDANFPRGIQDADRFLLTARC
jgi:tetratricopeptide (TPR) repeat protein